MSLNFSLPSTKNVLHQVPRWDRFLRRMSSCRQTPTLFRNLTQKHNSRKGILGQLAGHFVFFEQRMWRRDDYKIVLNIPGLPAISKDKDGENLLDPLTRLKVCDDAIVNLRRIYNILVQMKYQCMYTTTWAQVLNEKLPLETFFVIDSKNIVDGIINDFNKLK